MMKFAHKNRYLKMKDLWNKSVGRVVGVVVFVAALAQIAGYLETSKKWPEVAGIISSIVSADFLNLAYRLLFLFAVALGLWWLNKRLELVEERLQKLEVSKEPYVTPKSNEVIHPPIVGVLWAWNAETNAAGDPFCPRHRDRLFYKHAIGLIEAENLDERWLSSGWLFCPTDSEEFKFMERTIKVQKLRDEATVRLRSKISKEN